MKKNGFEDYENLTFSWVVPSNLSKSKIIKRKAASPLGRLYHKIKNQIESHKENSQIEYTKTNINQSITRNETYNDFPPNNDNQILNISAKIITQPIHNINKSDLMQNSNLEKENKIFSNKEIFFKQNKLIKKEEGIHPSKFGSGYYQKNNNILRSKTNNNNKRYKEEIPNLNKKINNYTKFENNTKTIKTANTKMRKININTYNSNYIPINNNEIIHRKSNRFQSPKYLNNNLLKLNNQPQQTMKLRNDLLNDSHQPIEPNFGGRNFNYYKENNMIMNNSFQNQNYSSFNKRKIYNSINQY